MGLAISTQERTEQNQLGSRWNGERKALVARLCAWDPVALFAETSDQNVYHCWLVVDHKNSGCRRLQHHREQPSFSGDASLSNCDGLFPRRLLLGYSCGSLRQSWRDSPAIRFCTSAYVTCAACTPTMRSMSGSRLQLASMQSFLTASVMVLVSMSPITSSPPPAPWRLAPACRSPRA